MPNFFKITKKQLSKMERGQVLMVVAISLVGLIAIIGIALDVGVMFIENARLRRAVDSAALAAALQFRQGYTTDNLDRSAEEFLALNGIHDPNALVQVCMDPAPAPSDPDYIHYDAALCTVPPRKLVKVVARGTAYLVFMPVIGINSAPIVAEAISETASVDVVLVLDRSDSMTWGADVGDPMRDPSICNAGSSGGGYVGDCHPFDEVKRAAVSFVNQLYFPYDSVSVVSFDKDAAVLMTFSNDQAAIINSIKTLRVFQGEVSVADPFGDNAIYPNGDPSRWYDPSHVYYGLDCPQTDEANHILFPGKYPVGNYSPAACTTTNIGAGLRLAGAQFIGEPPQSLWVVILLTDGVANAGYLIDGSGNAEYFCPSTTWSNFDIPPKCNDGDSSTRHIQGFPVDPFNPDYDAEDYAYDSADYIAGQHALLFTIGLGDKVVQTSTVDGTALGEKFLQYGASVGGGFYTFAPNAAQLQEIFRQIAENIATRLAH